MHGMCELCESHTTQHRKEAMWAECTNNIDAVLTITLPYEYTGSNLLGFYSNSVDKANIRNQKPHGGKWFYFPLNFETRIACYFTQHHLRPGNRLTAEEVQQKLKWITASWVTLSLLIQPRTTCPGTDAAHSGRGSPALNNNQDNPSQTCPRPVRSGQSLS